MTALPPIGLIENSVALALEEDLGLGGDRTSNSIFPADTQGTAIIAARQNGILAGQAFANESFEQIEPECEVIWHKQDGDNLKPNETIATIEGKVRTILTGERTALNFLGHLSGIATLTAQYVKAVKGTGANIVDTRKTTPTLRFAEKYAVRVGGGQNHRMRLDDAILIKDNHIAFAGGIEQAITKARQDNGHMIKIEVEVDTLEQLQECLKYKIDVVLLDNMAPEMLKTAVEMVDGTIMTEASGGITLDTVRAIAQTGVDIISVGALTHSAPCLDLGLDIDIADA